ncbi:MAG: alpha-amylase/4-alpha-glucanotransferase domain-containing protein, partial [Acidobacteriota bacterium]
MMEWVLLPDDYDRFQKLKQETPAEARRLLRGGFFREFFLKYPEANHLHKRMLLVSCQVSQNSAPEAAAELYKGQCNDPYWHGVFGGLYLPHLRESAYFHLLEAERKSACAPGWTRLDYDLDGSEELLYRGQEFNLLLKPSHGGSLVEFDDRLLSRNLSDVLSRREESYHRQKGPGPGEGKSIHELAKRLPDGAASLLHYDWHPRYSLLDHFLHPGVSEDDFRRVDYREQGDFVNQEYLAEVEEEEAVLCRQGHVWIEKERSPVKVVKRIRPQRSQVSISYEVENQAEREIEFHFGVEWNFYLLAGEWEFRKETLALLGGRWIMKFSPGLNFWSFPLETLSQSEEGYDIIRQGTCFLPYWKFSLASGQRYSLAITLREGNER